MRVQRPGLRARLALLLIVVFVAISGLLAWIYWRDRDSRLTAAKSELLADTRLIAARHQALVARADAILNGLIWAPDLQTGAPAATCAQKLAELQKREAAYLQVGEALPNGDLFCSAVPAKAPVNFQDRAWFQRTLKTRDLVVGDVIVSRIVGKPAITISKARWDDSGRATRVFYLALNMEWMAHEVSKTRLHNDARLTILDGQGVVAARFPDPEALTGKDSARTAIVQQVLAANGEGTLEETNSLGERRLIAHAPLLTTAGGSNYQLVLSTLKQTVEGPAQRDALISLAVLLTVLGSAMAALLVGGSRLLLQPVLTLAKTATRLRDGELGARSGLPHGGDEIGQLAQTLDESAAAIEDRERRLAYANRALRVLSAGNRTLPHGHGEQALLDQMCQAIVEAGGFRLAWVGYVQNHDRVQLMASAGAEAGLLASLEATWNESSAGRGPVGRALRQGAPVSWAAHIEQPTTCSGATSHWPAVARQR